jgi:competence protein ComFC
MLKLFENVLDYIFPKECYGCEREGEYLCSSCFDKVSFIENQPCYICNELGYENGICSKCRGESQIDKIIVATTYSENFVSRIVEQLKYNFIEDLAGILAKIIDKQIVDKDFVNDIYNVKIVPIPLHRKRYIERGFNQSEKIAKYLGEKYGGEIDEELLIRNKNTSQQAKLNRKERFENLSEAFGVRLGVEVPKKVVLVDDVLTTGVTFGEAVRVLKKSGVEEVVCVAVCHG